MGKEVVPIRRLPPDQTFQWPSATTDQEEAIDPAAIQDAWLDIRNDPKAVRRLLRRLNGEEKRQPGNGQARRVWTRRILDQMLSPELICAMAECSPTLCRCQAEAETDDPEDWVEWGLTTRIDPADMESPSRATEGFERKLHNALDA